MTIYPSRVIHLRLEPFPLTRFEFSVFSVEGCPVALPPMTDSSGDGSCGNATEKQTTEQPDTHNASTERVFIISLS